MPTFGRMRENVMRAFDPTKAPTIRLKQCYQFLTSHIVYYTHRENEKRLFLTVNRVGAAGGAKTIVDVDHGNAGGAIVQQTGTEYGRNFHVVPCFHVFLLLRK